MRTVASYKYPVISIVILIVIGADQTTKYLASRYASSFVCNEGIAFGLPFANTLLLLLILIFVSLLAFRQKNSLAIFALSLILGGGISNLVDRLTFGCVRDFITIGIWPSFNVADVAISVGSLVIVYNLISNRKGNSDSGEKT